MKGKVFGRGFGPTRNTTYNERKPKYLERKLKTASTRSEEIEELNYEGSNFFLELDELLAGRDEKTTCSDEKQGKKPDGLVVPKA